MGIDLNHSLAATLKRFGTRLHTERIAVGPGLLPTCPVLLTQHLPRGRWLLVADATTWEVAGRAVAEALRERRQPWRSERLAPPRSGDALVATDAAVDRVIEALGTANRFSAAVAIGSGTVNDIVKLACTRVGRPYAVVATAPSMNGYTSAIAAILTRGVKTTVPCRPPVLCLADAGVIAGAPYPMISSGFGDLLSKPVSNADWLLAHLLLDCPYDSASLEVVEQAAELLRGQAERLAARDLAAVCRLAASLCLSGLAMCLAGTSAPASGGEHLISHYLDMQHYAAGTPHDLHGRQVGVATLVSASFYQRLLTLSPKDLRRPEETSYPSAWGTWKASLESHFGTLADAVLPYARQRYLEPLAYRRRVRQLRAALPRLQTALRAVCTPPDTLRAELEAAQCPVRFRDLGVSEGLARSAIRFGRNIRDRYTILDLAAELGFLDSWTDAVLRELS